MVDSSMLIKRGIAVIVDTTIISIFLYLLLLINVSENLILQGSYIILVSFIPLLYFILLEGIFGQTLGKKLVKIRVTGEKGEKLTWKASITRNILRIIDILPTLYIIGAITIYFTKKDQRLGDIIAKTTVIEAKLRAEKELSKLEESSILNGY